MIPKVPNVADPPTPLCNGPLSLDRLKTASSQASFGKDKKSISAHPTFKNQVSKVSN